MLGAFAGGARAVSASSLLDSAQYSRELRATSAAAYAADDGEEVGAFLSACATGLPRRPCWRLANDGSKSRSSFETAFAAVVACIRYS